MTSRWQRVFKDRNVRRAALLIALWVPALIALIVVREVLLPFLLALFLAYVIAPPVRWLSQKTTLPRWVAVVVLYAVAGSAIWLGGRIVVPQLYREVQRLAGESAALYQQLSDENIEKESRELASLVERYNLPVSVVLDDLDPGVGDAAPTSNVISIDLVKITQGVIRDAKEFLRLQATHALSQIRAIIAWLVRFVFSTFLVLMLAAFVVADSERIVDFLLSLAPHHERQRIRNLLGRIDTGLSGVVRGQLTICIINGVLTIVGLLLLKVKFAFLLGILAAVFSLVPIFGSILSTIPIVIVALSSGMSSAFLALLWIVTIHALEANLLNPKIMGDAAKIHPLLVILALIVGEHYYGLAGALLAVPLISILATIFKAARTRALQLDEEIIQDETRGGASFDLPPPGRRRRMRTTEGG